MLHMNSPWVCLIKACSNGGATYFIGGKMAKDNLKISNLMQNLRNFLLCLIKVCSNGGATYFIGGKMAKVNLKISNLMQNLRNFLL